jgi:hypothetical protein
MFQEVLPTGKKAKSESGGMGQKQPPGLPETV